MFRVFSRELHKWKEREPSRKNKAMQSNGAAAATSGLLIVSIYMYVYIYIYKKTQQQTNI